jgi:hypothetical protein
MRDHDRVRINAQLIAAAPEKHLWAEKYEGNLSEVLTLQDEEAKAIAREIRIKLTPGEQTLLNTARPVAPEAREASWKRRYLWEQTGETNLTKSREYFEKAIEKDPGYITVVRKGLLGTVDACLDSRRPSAGPDSNRAAISGSYAAAGAAWIAPRLTTVQSGDTGQPVEV